MKSQFFILFILLFPAFSDAEVLELKGNYNGKNIYILNPSMGPDTVYCVDSVSVNDKTSNDETHSNAFEIDLSAMKLEIGSAVFIKIFHKSGCAPKIINPEAVKSKNGFLFISTKIDKAGKISWSCKGDPGILPFKVEQFRWKKWLEIGAVEVTDTIGKNQYFFDTKMQHFGQNSFRIRQTDAMGGSVYSKEMKFKSTKLEVMIESLKVSNEIKFSAETMYEIYDDKGTFVSQGSGVSVNISDLAKGKYWINYDNKTDTFTKK
jgi:hypothetical protein